MFNKFSNRREFLRYGWLSVLLFLNSCSKSSKSVSLALQNSFYPESFKETIPNFWEQKKVNFGNVDLEKNKNIILNSDFTLINDGWINNLNFDEFTEIKKLTLFENLDNRSIKFLNTFETNKRNKIFPVGVIPYAIIIKNNREIIKEAEKSWDFLLSKKLTKKIILPESPRIIISIAEKIQSSNSLAKLKSQAMLFDDQNSLNWLINSDACIAIVPFSLCSKYLKMDSRLSLVFPKQGVPLMWHLILSKSDISNEILIRWINSLANISTMNNLSNQGWYLPFKDSFFKNYKKSMEIEFSGPSQKCWNNSWSLPILSNAQKIKLESLWKES